MTLLVIGDLHFQEKDPQLYILFTKKVEEWLSTKDYIGVVLLGDIQHKFKTVDRVAQTLVCELFKTITRFTRLYVLVGNHDYDNGAQFLSENHTLVPFKEWPNIEIIDSPKVFQINGQDILMVPYVPKGRFLEAIENIDTKYKLVLAHQEFMGSLMGPYPSIDGDLWSDKFPIVLSGHAHTRHNVGNVWYVGMPYDDGWDESCKRYVAEIVLEKKIKINFIPTKMPRKIFEKLTYEEALAWAPKNTHDTYRLQVVCSSEEFKQVKKKLKDVRVQHITTDPKKVAEILEKRKAAAGKSLKYTDIFYNLIQGESNLIKDLYKKINE